MTGLRGRRDALLSLATIVYGLSAVPGARAYCYYDAFNRRHCTLSTGARIGIAIAIFIGFAVAIAVFTRMRMRSRNAANLAYVGTSPPAQGPPGYPNSGPSPYYNSTQSYAPQYPPTTYAGQSPYPSPNPPPGNLPQYAPPPGPPSGQQSYAPPPGPPPAQSSYAPPAGPPPFQGGPPQYDPPHGPPPTNDYKQAV